MLHAAFQVCAACLRSLHVRVSLHRCGAHPCPRHHSARCFFFYFRDSTSDRPSHRPSDLLAGFTTSTSTECISLFWFKPEVRSNTAAVHFLVWARWSRTRFTCARTRWRPHLYLLYPSTQELLSGTTFSGGLRMAHLCSHSSTLLDFGVNRGQTVSPRRRR